MSQDIQDIKAVVVDSDGMITYGDRFSERFSTEFDVEMEEMLPFFEGPFQKCLIGEADVKEELKPFLEEWEWEGGIDDLLGYWFECGDKVDESVQEVISSIRSDIPKALTTNNEKHRTEYLIKVADHDVYFDHIFSSAYVGAKKPESAFFKHVHQTLQDEIDSLNQQEILFWDDDPKNVSGAKNYGFRAYQYTDKDHFKKTLSSFDLLN